MPAPPPVLASALLDAAKSRLQTGSGNDSSTAHAAEEWDLMKDLDEGVSSVTGRSVLSCGRVVGISGLRSSGKGGQENDIRALVYELSFYILTTALIKAPKKLRNDPRHSKACVIQYFDSRPLEKEDLVTAVQERLPSQPVEEIENLVDGLQMYRAFDFDEILEAVDKVSDTLYDLQQRREKTARVDISDNDDNTKSISTKQPAVVIDRASKGTENEEQEAPFLLILEGVDQSLEEVIRASDAVAGHARLIPLLRTLTILSRTYASFLTIVVVNFITLPRLSSNVGLTSGTEREGNNITTPHIDDHGDHQPSSSSSSSSSSSPRRREIAATSSTGTERKAYVTTQPGQQQHSTSGPRIPSLKHHNHPLVPLYSIFSTADTVTNRGEPLSSRHSSILVRSLEQGFDTHLLVSEVQGQAIVECVKDRVGGSVGRWCVME
ncbi:hypothetical protein AJ80_09346 [Polytolypa hystricis UAMH7299]|uniref:Uncharacterized protein n=1 Tax=Polytolypa hystricis (strain UAMH7299) TaxID=1447883 RepID=A0A2B7WSL3_POLH7|nr:hypothetical protein AJ80_09346 [Polytolypa hystricis UAMH7299]